MHGCDFRIDLAKKKFYVIYFILFYFADTTINDKKGEEKQKKSSGRRILEFDSVGKCDTRLNSLEYHLQ